MSDRGIWDETILRHGAFKDAVKEDFIVGLERVVQRITED